MGASGKKRAVILRRENVVYATRRDDGIEENLIMY
jgi:hypothetical protein